MSNNSCEIPFKQGQQVVNKNEPGNIAIYTGKFRKLGSALMVELKFTNGSSKYFPLPSIVVLQENATSSLLEQMQAGLFGTLSDLRQLLTYEKLKGTLHEIVYSMEAAQIDFYPYQYKPVVKFINSPSERLLLADEVGLGKTIEAALIWIEMQARYQAKRLLVICPKILAEKWREELRQKFNISAKIIEFNELNHEVSELEKYGDNHSFVLIGTYSGLKPPRGAREQVKVHPEESIASHRKTKLLQKLRHWTEDYSPFDLVIFDEAHYMRNSATATFLLGESLAARARAVLCVSATPVNNSNTDLHSLLRLIDEDFFATQNSFEWLLLSNRPAVALANALAKYPVDQSMLMRSLNTMNSIAHITESPYFGDLCQKLELLEGNNFSDPILLAKCQDIAEKMNVLGSYVNRTRRVQVHENRAVRVPIVALVKYTLEEMDFYQAILRAVRRQCEKNNSEFHVFQVMTWQLMAASCLPAFVSKVLNRNDFDSGGLISEAFNAMDEDESPMACLEEETTAWSDLLKYDFEKNDSKFDKLLEILCSNADEKIIIFSYYRGTLAYLQRRLHERGIAVAMIHGGIPVKNRWNELDAFGSSSGPMILLASEVGSEGIDLQFCRFLINYDLPWNPMRVEQRIGRIDRVGQKATRLSIVNFKVKNTIEERIYERLHEKLSIFSNSLGDLDEVLGEEVRKLTIDLLSKNLTKEEENSRIEKSQQAIERKQLDMQHLENSGEGLVALSDYVQKKIEEDRGRGRYIQPSEMESYIANFFNKHFNGTLISYNTPLNGCMQITLSDDARSSFFHFIKDDNTIAATQLRARTITFTFDKNISRGNKNVNFINHISPLIKWITKINNEDEYTIYKISAMKINSNCCERGVYMYMINKLILDGILRKEKLVYGMINISNNKFINTLHTEKLFSEIFFDADEWIYKDYNQINLTELYNILEDNMFLQINDEARDFEKENENITIIKTQRLKTIFERKIFQDNSRLKTLIDNNRGEQIINMTRKRIDKNSLIFNEKCMELERKKHVEPTIEPIALGLVQINN